MFEETNVVTRRIAEALEESKGPIRTSADFNRLLRAAQITLPAGVTVGHLKPGPDDPPPPLGTLHKLLVGFCQEFVRSTTHLFVACKGAGLPFWEILPLKPRCFSR